MMERKIIPDMTFEQFAAAVNPPPQLTWGQTVLNIISLYDRGTITKEKLADGIWALISEATKIEREVNAQTAENMGSYPIAEEIRKGE